MTSKSNLKPTIRNRVMDLAEAAGLDVSGWANFKGGPKRAASNPKYCYEWSFEVPGKLFILNLWHGSLIEEDGEILQRLNMRSFAATMGRLGKKTVEKRAINMDVCFQKASSAGLPLRVIIIDGDMRDAEILESKASNVYTRELDSEPWAIRSYDWDTGDCVICRGLNPNPFVDQFSVQEDDTSPSKEIVTSSVYSRNPEVRKKALLRARGICELCSAPGFLTHKGEIYLESHHVVPLSEGGSDSINNVVALCPLCHKQAHHAEVRDEIRNTLKVYLNV